MHHIPLELVEIVFTFLSEPDLAALSATCSLWRHLAQRVLFRHITLNSRPRNTSCLSTLAQNANLALLVRTFALRVTSHDHYLSSFHHSLSVALSNMSELISLEVHIDQNASWVMGTSTTYPRLQRLACSFHLDSNLVGFLNRSTSINELEINSIPVSELDVFPLSNDALPYLTRFTGSALVAQAVVPGRPVQQIDLNSGDLTEDLAINLAKSTAPILALGANTTSHSVSLIRTLIRCMGHLIHLRIVSTYTLMEFPDITYFDNITDALMSLPDLKTCEIWGFHWVASPRSFNDNRKVWHSPTFNTNNRTTKRNFLYSDFTLP